MRPYTGPVPGEGLCVGGGPAEASAAGMAEKKAKTAEKGGDVAKKRPCPTCGADSRVVQFTGFGPRGFFWVCEKACGYQERT